ncbi:hypothetical protein [Allofournierella sp.]|uniref:hypothetical protein n=1 Tax=Allofournierella sp. TaxID=1940256 RepID=UPI0015B2BE27
MNQARRQTEQTEEKAKKPGRLAPGLFCKPKPHVGGAAQRRTRAKAVLQRTIGEEKRVFGSERLEEPQFVF